MYAHSAEVRRRSQKPMCHFRKEVSVQLFPHKIKIKLCHQQISNDLVLHIKYVTSVGNLNHQVCNVDDAALI